MIVGLLRRKFLRDSVMLPILLVLVLKRLFNFIDLFVLVIVVHIL